MFKEIYDFAKSKKLSTDFKYVERHIKYYVVLDFYGNLLDVEKIKDTKLKTYCPAYPPNKTHGKVSNFLVEKASIIFDCKNSKHAFYIEDIRQASKQSVELNSTLVFLGNISDENYLNNLSLELKKRLNEVISSTNWVSFKIGDTYIEEGNSWRNYFETHFNEMNANIDEENSKNEEMISVISGKKVIPISRMDPISVSGATTEGPVSLICCDKEAFSSYGLKNALNGAISKEEALTVSAGLKYLLKNNYHRHWNLIHWYEHPVSTDVSDIVEQFLSEKTDKEDIALQEFIEETINGNLLAEGESLRNNKYFFLTFKPYKGRAAFSDIRFGQISELLNNLNLFYSDSKINGFSISNIYSIFGCLLRANNDKDSLSKQINDNFSAYKKQQLMDIVFLGNKVPQDFVIMALNRIKIDKIGSKDKDKKNRRKTPSTTYKLLKVYINRDYRTRKGGYSIMSELSENNKNVGYNLGRLFCLYAKIQEKAVPGIGTSIVNGYYASASTVPGIVFGRLSNLSNSHLSKIQKESPGLAIYYKKLIQEICENIQEIPKQLDVYDQSNFALGYYQQEKSFSKKIKNNEEDNIDV